MKLVTKEILFAQGNFSSTPEWERIQQDVEESINKVTWPESSKKFTINPIGKGNGVKPIKLSFCDKIEKKGWKLETRMSIATRSKPGPLDATIRISNDDKSHVFAVEWETGNISSSHRALNKMSLGIRNGILIGGILVLPTRKLYQYLTDRVGNFAELEPYFDVWRSMRIKNGILCVYAVEYDDISKSVPRIVKGTDGRAKV